MNNSIIRIALVDFKFKQQESLVKFAARMDDDPSVWECIVNCVDLWNEADKTLKELCDVQSSDEN